MREVIIDSETTGLSPVEGHRLIELAAVEVFDQKRIGASYHCYINPEIELDDGAIKIHGISNEFLQDKLRFSEMVTGFLKFLGGATIVGHYAPFDIEFLDAETGRLGLDKIGKGREVIDTLEICRNRFSGQKNNLDALIKRFNIETTNRNSRGALLDAELLAEIYIQLANDVQN